MTVAGWTMLLAIGFVSQVFLHCLLVWHFPTLACSHAHSGELRSTMQIKTTKKQQTCGGLSIS